MYKIVYKAGRTRKTWYYEDNEQFEKWLVKHRLRYGRYGAVTAFAMTVLTDPLTGNHYCGWSQTA